MKKTIAIIILFFILSQNAFAVLKAKPDAWYIEGPGGNYGVFSCHSDYSVIMLGPVEFYSSYDFEEARLIYFGIIPILLLATQIGALLLFRKRKKAKKPYLSFKNIFGRYWDYFVLVLIVLLSIKVCIELPKYFAWRRAEMEDNLYHAIVDNDLDLVKEYISKDNINSSLLSKEGNYSSPLPLAAKKGHIELVKYFLENGADIESQGDDDSALHQACLSGKLNIVKYLIEQGADVNATGSWNRTPLDVATSRDIMECLIKHGGKTEEELKKEKVPDK